MDITEQQKDIINVTFYIPFLNLTNIVIDGVVMNLTVNEVDFNNKYMTALLQTQHVVYLHNDNTDTVYSLLYNCPSPNVYFNKITCRNNFFNLSSGTFGQNGIFRFSIRNFQFFVQVGMRVCFSLVYHVLNASADMSGSLKYDPQKCLVDTCSSVVFKVGDFPLETMQSHCAEMKCRDCHQKCGLSSLTNGIYRCGCFKMKNETLPSFLLSYNVVQNNNNNNDPTQKSSPLSNGSLIGLIVSVTVTGGLFLVIFIGFMIYMCTHKEKTY